MDIIIKLTLHAAGFHQLVRTGCRVIEYYQLMLLKAAVYDQLVPTVNVIKFNNVKIGGVVKAVNVRSVLDNTSF